MNVKHNSIQKPQGCMQTCIIQQFIFGDDSQKYGIIGIPFIDTGFKLYE